MSTVDPGPAESAEASAPPTAQIVHGTATEEELAALLAVLSEAYAKEASSATVEEAPVDAWSRTARGLRRPLRRDVAWGRFSGSGR